MAVFPVSPFASGPLGRQRGVSLVELLVALALGAFITVGIVQMFTANRETYQINIGQARLQENARFAIGFIERPLRMSGFTGCFSAVDEVVVLNRLNLVGGNVPFAFDFTRTVEGLDATAADTWSPPARAALLPAAIDLADVQDNTDLLVTRIVEPQGLRVVGGMASSAVPIQASAGDAARYGVGNVLLIADCEKSTVFESTGAAGTGPIQIDHAAGSAVPGVTYGNTVLTLTDDAALTYGAESTVHRVESQTFFIADGAGQNNRGDTPLSLWRQVSDTAPAELVEGVRDLQVLYGVDTDGDRVPNQYRRIQNVNFAPGTADRVVTVRVTLTVSSVDVVTDVASPDCPAGTPVGVLCRTFTKTIALRNQIR
ncbi:MAG: PilW family protein [Pseudomonadales bacterium]|jgi:type IV pilus assembly protein PilW|nr:PilW family protein [Pseudomonadales bacterium]